MVTMESVLQAIDPEEPDYRAAAAELGPDALPLLAEVAGGDDLARACKAVSLAGAIGGADALPLVEQAAVADRPQVRLVAAIAAGRLGSIAEPVLIDLLADGDPGVRKYALRAAGSDPSSRVLRVLEHMRRSDSDFTLRRRVTDVIGPADETEGNASG